MVSYKYLAVLVLVAASGLALNGAAVARNSYCCNDPNGRMVCGDILPAACQHRPYRIKDEKGQVLREVEAPLTPEQRAAREAENVRKLEEEKRLAEQKRRDMAMLATYPNAEAIDSARARALDEFDKASGESKRRHDEMVKRKKKLDMEKEFYQKKPMPAALKKQIDDADNDLKASQESLGKRQQEREALVAQFDEDKKRYADLRSGKVSRLADGPPAKSPAPVTQSHSSSPAGSAAAPPAAAKTTTRTIIIRETTR